MVSGKVQGIFYRASCEEIAKSYGLNGWVRNLPSGEVEVLAQGEKEKIEKLIQWCKKGPSGAKVIDVEVKWTEVKESFSTFFISQ